MDRVVADPGLNNAFIAECRNQGLEAAEATLNRALLNLRKAGYLRGIKSRSPSLGDDDAYRFAAEMAARHMERRDGVTLDDILCDPVLAAEFDKLASSISPGFTPLQYRWTRSSGQRRKEEAEARKVAQLESKLANKNEVIAASVQEHVQLKKELGDL